MTITEPELAETEIDPQARKVNQNWELTISFSWILQVKKRVVMVMARQHPGESPASYVVQVFECLLRVKI